VAILLLLDYYYYLEICKGRLPFFEGGGRGEKLIRLQLLVRQRRELEVEEVLRGPLGEFDRLRR
jgi:hypothetical protein